MNITKKQLKQIIQEEIENVLDEIAEQGAGPKPFTQGAADARAAALARSEERDMRGRRYKRSAGGGRRRPWPKYRREMHAKNPPDSRAGIHYLEPKDDVRDPLDPFGTDPEGSGGGALDVDYTVKGPGARTNIERAAERRYKAARKKRRKAAAAEKLKKNENMAPAAKKLNEKKKKACKPSKGKRFAKRVNGKCRSFGQAGKAKGGGDRIRPGTKKGDAYCARSAGIKKCKNPPCANTLSRKKWKCRGKKSMKEEIMDEGHGLTTKDVKTVKDMMDILKFIVNSNVEQKGKRKNLSKGK